MEKVGTLGLRATVRTNVVLPRSGQGRPGLWRLLRGTLAAANPGLLLGTSHTLCSSLAHLGSSGATNRVGGSQLAQASDNGRPGALLRGAG